MADRRSNLGLPESNKSVLPLRYLAGKWLQTLSVRKAAFGRHGEYKPEEGKCLAPFDSETKGKRRHFEVSSRPLKELGIGVGGVAQARSPIVPLPHTAPSGAMVHHAFPPTKKRRHVRNARLGLEAT